MLYTFSHINPKIQVDIMVYRKGYAFERDVRLHLEKDGWVVIRSGKSRKPDMVAARNGKIIVIECKSLSSKKAYLEKDEVEKLREVAEAFCGECVYAIKHTGNGWSLVPVSELREVDGSYVFDGQL